MNRSLSALAHSKGIAAAIAAGVLLCGAGLAAEAAQSAQASRVSANGVTLRSVSLDFPDNGRMFEGRGSDAVNANCLACHSAGMILTQPRMARAAWQAEVEKMRKTYKAPVDEKDVPAIVDYLAGLAH
jgi:cytochrome c5